MNKKSKRPETLTEKLERIARDYRDDMEHLIERLNEEFDNDLTKLAMEYGTPVAQEAIDIIPDNLSVAEMGIYPHTSLQEAFSCVEEVEVE